MKEQIEEMAVIMREAYIKECIHPDCHNCEMYNHDDRHNGLCKEKYRAEALYNAGYRKQKEGENISQMHPSDEFICEKCGLIIRECCRYEIDEDDGDEICYEFPYRFCPRCGMKVKGGAE